MKFISVNNLNPNIEFVEQYLDKHKNTFVSEIDLRFYINKIKEKNIELEKTNVIKYKGLITTFKFEYEKIKYKLPNNKYKFSLKPSDDEIINILFNKLKYEIKLKIMKTIISNKINNNDLSTIEKLLEKLNVSKGKLDSMIKNNQIPFIRMGKVIETSDFLLKSEMTQDLTKIWDPPTCSL